MGGLPETGGAAGSPACAEPPADSGGTAGAGGVPVDPPPGCENVITFTDPNLEYDVRYALGIASADLYYSDVVQVTRLELGSTTPFSDLECLLGLTGLIIRYDLSQVDITPLATLPVLTWLDLTSTEVNVSQLSAFPALTALDLNRNGITDVTCLAGLTELRGLELSGNAISDIAPLSGLTNLRNLDLGSNLVGDLSPISGMTELHSLQLLDNDIMSLDPLVANPGLGEDDFVDVGMNPFDCLGQLANILALENRGVRLMHGCD